MMVESNASDHSIVQIRDEDGLKMETSSENRNEVEVIVSRIRGKLHQKPPLTTSSCIFRIPNVLRRHNKKAFLPKIVSIGPFHHGEQNLQAMEEIKLWYLHCLLERKPTPETSLEYFVQEIKGIEQHCRDCYGEKIDMSSEQFVEMMVVDGCFIVELVRKNASEVVRDEDDPVFNTYWMKKALRRDLLLLENQLPWKVVDCLFHHTITENDKPNNSSLLQLAQNFIHIFSLSVMVNPPLIPEASETRHLLDILRISFLNLYPDRESDSSSSAWDPIPSVTELLQSGVEFKVRDDSRENIPDITFENGVMKIPPVHISVHADSLFRNLIAYEQCNPSTFACTLTSYAVIMDNLINSSEDAGFLIQKGIIATKLSKEEIAGIFNRLYNDTYPGYFSYLKLTEDVNAYYKGRWHRWQAILRRDYFSNPWSAFSLAAALFILGFTFLQTLYSILTYY